MCERSANAKARSALANHLSARNNQPHNTGGFKTVLKHRLLLPHHERPLAVVMRPVEVLRISGRAVQYPGGAGVP